MTRDDIIRMAREAGCEVYDGDDIAPALTRFAALVAAAERQRCAQIAREFDREHPLTNCGRCIARLIEETTP